MFYRIFLGLVLSALCAVSVSAPPGERYIVQFEDGRGAAGRAAVANVGTVARDLARHNAVAAHIPDKALAGLRRNPNVAYVEIDAKRFLQTHAGGQEQPYGIGQVQADQVAYQASTPQKICIIDSGYELGHEDLPTADGTNDSGTGNWFEDGDGHGTHVAGTIAAVDNSVGVVGVIPGTTDLHIVRVFGDSGSWSYSSDLVAALDVCEANGANVVSMSLGGSFRSRTEQRAFGNAYNRGVLSIAAAGNDGNTRKSYPASYDSVVSVAATDINKSLASFSQRNDQVELAAPGVGVLSTVPTGTGSHSVVVTSVDTYESAAMDGSPNGSVSGPLVSCGLGTSTCPGGGGQVCLIQRGDISFADKVLACQAGGGAAAVIYNNVPGMLYGTLGETVTSIPSVGTSDTIGADLLLQIGSASTVDVVATNYAAWDGTSMATPHVSGVAALLWSNHSTCTNDEIRAALAATAEDLGEAGRDTSYGHGLVQVADAVSYLDANACGSGGGGGGGGGGGSCPLLPVGASCTLDAECCSGKCKGPGGGKSCK